MVFGSSKGLGYEVVLGDIWPECGLALLLQPLDILVGLDSLNAYSTLLDSIVSSAPGTT